MIRTSLALIACVVLTVTTTAQWPQWRGPQRDGRVADANVPTAWPEKLTARWRQEVGEGYSTPSVANGLVFVHSRQDPEEVVTALDLATGKPVWTARYASAFSKNKYASSMSKGPFSTPLVSDGMVYTLGTSAVLSAFDERTGALEWRKDWSKEIDTSTLFTGTAMSPIIDHGVLVVHVGDDTEGAFRAFDPRSGAEKWSLPDHGPGYASPIIATFGGTRQLVTMTDKAVVGVSVTDGRLLWQIPFPDEWNENIVTPAVAGDVLVVSGTRKGTYGFRISKSDGGFAATQLWHNADLPMYMSSPVVDGNRYVYGFSSRRKGQIFCLDASSGKAMWVTEGRTAGSASLQIAGPDLVVLTTEGDLLLVRKSPEKFAEWRRYKVADSQTWAHPVITTSGVVVRDAGSVAFWAF